MHKIVKVYDRLDAAENARRALLESGFGAESLELTATPDEAGPVEGNFVLEYKDAERNNDKSFLDSLFAHSDPNEGLANQPVKWRATCILTVEAADQAQLDLASEITDRFGAIDPANR